jgi:ADP-ribose pyrophosphatase
MEKSKFTKHDVEVLGKTNSHDGYFNLNIITLRHRLFKGGWSEPLTREIFERGHAVAVLPYDPLRDEVLLIEQFRPGAHIAMVDDPWFENDTSPWLLEAVAGIIEDGERPEDVAYREALEETGTQITDLIPISHYLATPGGSTESVFCFIGRVNTGDVKGLHGVDHEGEDIRPFTVPLDDAYGGIEIGRVNNAMTIIALQYLMLNRAAVRERWS